MAIRWSGRSGFDESGPSRLQGSERTGRQHTPERPRFKVYARESRFISALSRVPAVLLCVSRCTGGNTLHLVDRPRRLPGCRRHHRRARCSRTSSSQARAGIPIRRPRVSARTEEPSTGRSRAAGRRPHRAIGRARASVPRRRATTGPVAARGVSAAGTPVRARRLGAGRRSAARSRRSERRRCSLRAGA